MRNALKNFLAASLSATLVLSGCSHHHATDQASNQPAPHGDSEYTGVRAQPLDSFVKTPPRALPVTQPPPASTPAISEATPIPAANGIPPPAPAEAPMETPPASVPPSISVPGSEGLASSTNLPTPSVPSSPQGDSSAYPDHDQVVILQTSEGRIIIELDDFAAPKTCKNFRQLVADGFYNNTVFHRVIPNFIIQGGDPKSKSSATDRNTYGLGGPGYTLPAEINLKHDRGAVAMARLPDSVNPQKESNGSQFYICVASCPSLDDQYTVFGHVIRGMEVADAIANEQRDIRDNPLKRVEMKAILEPKEQAVGAGTIANP